MKTKFNAFPVILVTMAILLLITSQTGLIENVIKDVKTTRQDIKDITNKIIEVNRQEKVDEQDTLVPEYSGEQTLTLNDNIPFFTNEELLKAYDENNNITSFIELNELDSLGRAQSALMCAGPETLADEDRGDISSIHPSGWKQAKYEFINGKYLYNRCHLLAHCLSELNAEERNLITCTRQTNASEMLDYELSVVEYIEETGNHVLYRVTPCYDGDNLLASGILMEAMSLEEAGLEFCVYIYNVQDGVNIDYSTGLSSPLN